MKVCYAKKNNLHHIMEITDEGVLGYAFNDFGTAVKSGITISHCSGWLDVDYVSFIGVSSNSCEILCNGVKGIINKPLFDCLKVFRDSFKYFGTMFNMSYGDDLGKFTQVIFVMQIGSLDINYVSSLLGVSSWEKIS